MAPQAGDPAHTLPQLELVDLSLRQHSTIPSDHDRGERESRSELVHLVRHRAWIGGVAGIHLERDRASLAVGEQAVEDDREARLVAIVSEASQRAALPGVEAGAGVVEDQRSLLEMALGQLGFDALLACEEPVEGGVELLDLGVGDAEFARQAGVVPSAGRRELRTGMDQALCDHPHHQAPLPARLGGKDGVESELAHGSEDRHHVAVRQSADDVEGVIDTDEGLALEEAAEGLDLVLRPVGQVGEGLLDDAAVLALALAEEDGGRGVAVGDGLDVHGNHYTSDVNTFAA